MVFAFYACLYHSNPFQGNLAGEGHYKKVVQEQEKQGIKIVTG